MQRHIEFTNLPITAKGATVAMGNFDGVHLGHQSVLDLARRPDQPLGVITFEPHPRRLFQPDAPPFRLMTADTRAGRFAELGVDHLYELAFTRDLANLSATDFVRDVLVAGLGIKNLVVGADFHFGKGRTGDAALLAEMGAGNGFTTTIAPLVGSGESEYSSTAIRQALSDGNPRQATEMLGQAHRIEGRVEKGFQRGRDLGFPTANLALHDLHLPKFGVYAVKVDVRSGPHKGTYNGAASLGNRPTFGENIPNFETFLLDFSGDLYGADLSVSLIEFIRPELKFDDLDALVKQMHADCDQCREILGAA